MSPKLGESKRKMISDVARTSDTADIRRFRRNGMVGSQERDGGPLARAPIVVTVRSA
jgi:hypothetical protein